MIKIKLKDNSEMEVEEDLSVLEIAKKLVKDLQELQHAQK